jgi:hypothetical protein
MTGGPEELGDVAKSVVGGFIGRPDFLALVVLNCVVFGLFAYLSYARSQNEHAEFLKIFEACYDRQAGNGGPH